MEERGTDVIIQLGIFHKICNFLSILGKHFQDAGLEDICIEAEITTEGSSCCSHGGASLQSNSVSS